MTDLEKKESAIRKMLPSLRKLFGGLTPKEEADLLDRLEKLPSSVPLKSMPPERAIPRENTAKNPVEQKKEETRGT